MLLLTSLKVISHVSVFYFFLNQPAQTVVSFNIFSPSWAFWKFFLWALGVNYSSCENMTHKHSRRVFLPILKWLQASEPRWDTGFHSNMGW